MSAPADRPGARPVTASQTVFAGRIWDVRRDAVTFAATSATRDVLVHPGAVAVLAIDEQERVLLIEQYRHPVQARLLELPAGLLDQAGEPPHLTAARELAEEAGLTAGRWWQLLDVAPSPGGSSEWIRIFVARDLQSLPGGRVHTGEAEEADLPQTWLSLTDAVAAVLEGRVHNGTTVAGLLAAAEAARQGWAALRPAVQPWPPLSS